MNETLRPHERIRQREDFLFLFKKGKRYKGKNFILIYLSRETDFSRMAVIVSKKIGNAVVRNKIKRRMRALFRTNKERIKGSFDLIFIVKKEIREANWQTIKKDYLLTLKHICMNNTTS